MSIPPNQTLYVKNLNEKARKLGTMIHNPPLAVCPDTYARFEEGIVRSLRSVWTHSRSCCNENTEDAWPGCILLNVLFLMFRQAFIVFRDVVAATNAMRDLQNFLFFDKPMVSPLLPLPVLFHRLFSRC